MFVATKYQVVALDDFPEIDFPEIHETGQTFAENARLKAETSARSIHRPVMADDSCLVVDALNGQPGIYSARYAGNNATDQQNYEKLLIEMKDIPKSKRKAKFVAVLALA